MLTFLCCFTGENIRFLVKDMDHMGIASVRLFLLGLGLLIEKI